MSLGERHVISMVIAIAVTVAGGLREKMDFHFFVVQCVMSD